MSISYLIADLRELKHMIENGNVPQAVMLKKTNDLIALANRISEHTGDDKKQPSKKQFYLQHVDWSPYDGTYKLHFSIDPQNGDPLMYLTETFTANDILYGRLDKFVGSISRAFTERYFKNFMKSFYEGSIMGKVYYFPNAKYFAINVTHVDASRARKILTRTYWFERRFLGNLSFPSKLKLMEYKGYPFVDPIQ